MIDWSKLKPYEGYKYKSFEELCFQVAKKLYENEGIFTSIDDSGGGDYCFHILFYYLYLTFVHQKNQLLADLLKKQQCCQE